MERILYTEYEKRFLRKHYSNHGPKWCAAYLKRPIESIRGTARKLNLLYNKNNKYAIYSDRNILQAALNKSSSIIDCLRNLGLCSGGGNPARIKYYIKLYNLDLTQLEINRKYEQTTRTQSANKSNRKYELVDLLIKDAPPTMIGSIKEKLYNAGLKERKCERCQQGEEWRGEKMSLILDHINGIRSDNRLENLRILCPNCNATLDTHCRGAQKIKDRQEKIADKELKKEIQEIEKRKKYKLIVMLGCRF